MALPDCPFVTLRKLVSPQQPQHTRTRNRDLRRVYKLLKKHLLARPSISYRKDFLFHNDTVKHKYTGNPGALQRKLKKHIKELENRGPHTHMTVCDCVCGCVRVCDCMCVCACACVYVCSVCVYIYIYVYARVCNVCIYFK